MQQKSVPTTKILAFEPDQESRYRLKQVLAELGHGRQVRFAATVRQALALLQTGMRYESVLISSVLSQEKLDEFIRDARITQGGKRSSYVLLLKGNERHKGYVAQNLMQGIQGFLCEPYSVDDVREFLAVVAEASAAAVAEEKVSTAAAEFLLDEILRRLEAIANNPDGTASYGCNLPALKKVSEALRAACPNIEDYAEILTNKVAAAAPSQVQRKRKVEDVIIEAAPAKAPERMQARIIRKR
jgi:CheY-like chemotaxis protein